MAAKSRKVWYLRRLNLFSDLTPQEIETVASRLGERACSRREIVLNPHSPGDRVYIVKSGSVRLYRLSPEGRQLTTAVLRPGQLFGTPR
jgi:CRP-like cAMP-binding protein